MNLKLSQPVALLLGISVTSIGSATATNCKDESCATCNENGCLTCADGSPVITKRDEDWGVCGKACPLCYDDLDPAYPDKTYFRATSWVEDGISNCSSALVMLPELIEEGADMCLWVQRNTYLQCGCPALPPLRAPSDEPTLESCTMCADGSQPLNANATVEVTGFYSGSFQTTCALFAETFAHPRLGSSFMSSPLSRDTLECSKEQYKYYKKCGCPKPVVPENGCTLCADGAPVAAEFSSAIVMSDGKPISDENTTCAEEEEDAPFSGHEKDSWACNEYTNSWGAESCGCAPPYEAEGSAAFDDKNALPVVLSIAASVLLMATQL